MKAEKSAMLVPFSKSCSCREVFVDFDPSVVAKLSEKRVIAPGITCSSLLSELKLRSIIENARQILKVFLFSSAYYVNLQ